MDNNPDTQLHIFFTRQEDMRVATATARGSSGANAQRSGRRVRSQVGNTSLGGFFTAALQPRIE